MDLNKELLKGGSIEFETKLRLPVKFFNIRIDNHWKNFKEFVSDVIETPGGHRFKTEVKNILIDTGNEANFIVLSASYLNTFRKKIRDIKTKTQIIEDFQGNKRVTDVSNEIFEFKISKTIFRSKIGFTYQTSVNAMDIINIGIKSVCQFLNIIYSDDNRNYYFCANI